MNRLTIKTRMIFAGIVMALLFFFFGMISINQMNRLGDLTATLYEHPLQVSNAALKAKVGVIKMHRSMKDVSTSTTQLSATLAIQSVLSEEQRVYAELDTIRKLILGEEGKALVEETTNLFAGWKPIRVEVEELVLQGQRDAANQITRGKGADYVARLERKMSALTAYAIHKADGFMADARKTESRILNNTITFISIMVLAAIGVSVFMAVSILSSVTALKQAMTGITETVDLKEARLEGSNEITEMARNFNGLIRRLKSQFWLGDGQNELNTALSGEMTPDEIMEKAIQTVCRYTGACAGAIYRLEEKVCELRSSYALVNSPHLANRFPLGHGIIGQAALEKKPILLTEINNKEAVGSSATVKQVPAAIYALPLIHENRVFGVMETASFETISPVIQRYLEFSSRAIAGVLRDAYQRERITHLLKQYQSANESLKTKTRELQNQAEELQALNQEFRSQSQELKIQNRALEDQRIEVEAANRLKSEFLSNMSHELRTPLNSVNALSKVLMRQAGEKLSPEELEYLSIIRRNGSHLLSLINDILDLSKIEAGRVEMVPNEFSLNAMIDTIEASMTPLAREKDIRLVSETDPDIPRMFTDESRVLQIVQNIVANAVKFTESGHVRISARMAPKDPGDSIDQVCVAVEDTGIGIPAQDMASIFEEFRQVDGASTRKFEGSGLGLSIAYKAAKLLGGDIRVESVQGQGSTFRIFLPVRYQGPGADESAHRDNATRPPVPGRDALKILAVDDDPQALAVLSTAFIQGGYQCITAESGKEALGMARTEAPDAITLDILMPDMDGWEVIGALKNDPATEDIPVLIVSASQNSSTGFALGAVGYVTKPVARDDLIREMDRLFTGLPSRILVVDDTAADREQTAGILESRGIEVLTAENGRACMDILAADPPDLLILDLIMPVMDGFTVLRQIRSDNAICHLPVIIVTAKDLSREERRLLESQAAAVLTKDKDANLVDRIAQILNRIPMEDTGVKQTRNPAVSPSADQRQESVSVQPPSGEKPLVLVIEDNPDNMITIKAVLGQDYAVIGAGDGRQGIEKAVSVLPDLILLDISLPVMDGFQVVKSLKHDDRTKQIPVVALTAQAMKGDREKILAAGCDDYIAKPVEPETVIPVITRWIEPALRKQDA